MKKALYAVAVIATVTIAGWTSRIKKWNYLIWPWKTWKRWLKVKVTKILMKQQVAMQQSVQKFVVHTFMHQKQTVHVIYVTK